ncbi:MAG: hypothetical protein LBD91_03655 [Prevotellaceae bacterium]|jgi:hypothetical protein|nr:hypothetical protein [Prevotellaceae bacterium]
MKKSVLIVLLTAFSVSMYAQSYEKSIGLRLGKPLGLTYKQFVTNQNAIEGILDLDLFTKDAFNLCVSGFYTWQWNLANVKGLDWFVGPGASAGLFFVSAAGSTISDFNVSLNGLIGLEYKFDGIPLAISADFGPRFYFLNSAGFYWGGALSVRYTF